MSKRFFASFDHGGYFVINSELYIDMPDACYVKPEEIIHEVIVKILHNDIRNYREFIEVPEECNTGEAFCKWVTTTLLPMYEEWKIRGGRTPWELEHKTEKEEFLCSLLFPYPLDETGFLHLEVKDGKIVTMLGSKVLEELPEHISCEGTLRMYGNSFRENEFSDKAIKCCICEQLYPSENMKIYNRGKKREYTNYQNPYYSYRQKRFVVYPWEKDLPKAPQKNMTGGFIYKEIKEYICPRCLEEQQTEWWKAA